MRRFVTFGPAFVVLLAAVVTLVAAPAAVRRLSYANTDATIRLAQHELDAGNILEEINKSVRNIAKSVEPSVVHIAVEAPGPRGYQRMRVSQGSGWVYDEKGDIVTNAHVVRGAPAIMVQFFDGRTVQADVVGVDTPTDIAVIHVKNTEGLFPARRGTGEELAQGDRVYAFGSPFGFKFSMSEGIISGLGRDPTGVLGQNPGGYTNFIQTDAAVNPGNSGGPLVDVNGRVVGMNVAIATGIAPTGASEGQSAGISFAIPLDTIESIVGQLVNGGVVAKGFMGIVLPDEDTNTVQLSKRKFDGHGVFVGRIYRDGPADQAGIKVGDIITEVQGRKVTNISALRQFIAVNRPGEEIPLKVWRNGKDIALSVKLGDLTQSTENIDNTTKAMQEYGIYSAVQTEGGLQIKVVVEDSEAAAAGFRPGQVIVKIDDQDINNVNDLITVLVEKGFTNGRRLNTVVVDQVGNRNTVEMQYRP